MSSDLGDPRRRRLGIIAMRLVIGKPLAVERYPPLVDGAFVIIAWASIAGRRIPAHRRPRPLKFPGENRSVSSSPSSRLALITPVASEARGVSDLEREAKPLIEREVVSRSSTDSGFPGAWTIAAHVLLGLLIVGGSIRSGGRAVCGGRARLTCGVGDTIFLSNDGGRSGSGSPRCARYRHDAPDMQHAMVAIEDRRFYYHPGIDPIGLGEPSSAA